MAKRSSLPEQLDGIWATDGASPELLRVATAAQVGVDSLGTITVQGSWRQRRVRGGEGVSTWHNTRAFELGVSAVLFAPRAIALEPSEYGSGVKPTSQWRALKHARELSWPVEVVGANDTVGEYLDEAGNHSLGGYGESRQTIANLVLHWLGSEPSHRPITQIGRNARITVIHGWPRQNELSKLVDYARNLAESNEIPGPKYLINIRSPRKREPVAMLVLTGIRGSVKGAYDRQERAFGRDRAVVPLHTLVVPDDELLHRFREYHAAKGCTNADLLDFLKGQALPSLALNGNDLNNLVAFVNGERGPVRLEDAAIAAALQYCLKLPTSRRRLELGNYGHVGYGGVKMNLAYEPAGDPEVFYAMLARKLKVKRASP